MQPLQIRFLGGVRITRGPVIVPVPTPQRTALLAYLLTFGDRLHARRLLAGLFWGEKSDAAALHNLSDALFQLRAELEPGVKDRSQSIIASPPTSMGLNPQARVWIDVQEFLRLTGPGATLEQQLEALDFYQGDFLPGFYYDWVLLERERLAARYRETLTKLLTHYQNSGDLDQALEMGRRLVASDPLQEEANRELMRLYYRAGRRDRALTLYHTLRQKLADELEVEPEPATTELFQTIQAGVSGTEEGGPRPDVAAAERASARVPGGAQDLVERLRHPPLLGRERERRRLAEWLALPRNAITPMVLLEGEAGVGKSRLAAEVAEEAYQRNISVLRGTYHEMTAQLPYSGLVEALRTGLRLAGPPPLAPIWLSEVSRILPELANWHPNLPPPVALRPEQERLRLWEALVQYLLALAGTGPHLIIMENVHWIDPAALDLLQYILPRLPGTGFRLLATARREDLADRPDVLNILDALESSDTLERMPIPRLDAETIIELVRIAIAQDSAPTVFGTRLWEETEGNPYFALETLRLWAERGVLVQEAPGNWRIAGATSATRYAELPTPASVRRVLTQRVQRLDRAARAVLEVGSVLGDTLSESLLWRTSGSDPGMVLTPAEELLRRQLWIEQPGGYAFAHAKVREVVYETISGPRKRYLHRQAAGAIEAEHPSNIEALAHHYYLAEDWARALPHLLAAAERAQRSVAYTQAILHYEHAMHALDHLPAEGYSATDRWELRFTILTERARLYHSVGRLDEARADHDHALRLTEENDDCVRRAGARTLRARFLLEQGRLEDALHETRQALIEVRAGEPTGEGPAISEVEARIYSTLSRIYLRTGESAAGIAAEKQALDYYRAVGDQRGEADSLTQYASLLGRHGQAAEAKALLLQALDQARHLGDRPLEARILNNLGVYTQTPEETFELIQRYLAIGEEIGDLRAQRTGHANLAELTLRFGRYDEALEHAQQSIMFCESLNDAPGRAEAIMQRGRAWQARGEYGQARADITLGLGHLQTQGVQISVMWGLIELSRLMLEEGQWQPVSAAANIEKSYQLWRATAQPYGGRFASLFYALQAQAQLGQRRVGQARALVRRALAALEDEQAPELAGWVDTSVEVLARCYRVLAKTGPPAEAIALLERAHQRLELVADRCGPLLRQSYLENVPECRTIRAAWAQYELARDKTANLPRGDKGSVRRAQLLQAYRDAEQHDKTLGKDILARMFGVNERTILRDLEILRKEGLLP